MNSRLLIIGVVLITTITSIFILNYYIYEEIKSKKFNDEQIDSIFKRCDYQKMMDDRNWIGFDGNKITDHQPLYFWNNSTHHIDSEICEWELISNNTASGSYELDEVLCTGGIGYIVNDKCERIGKYDPDTGLPIVENKEQCDMLDGSWDNKQNHCDSKYG